MKDTHVFTVWVFSIYLGFAPVTLNGFPNYKNSTLQLSPCFSPLLSLSFSNNCLLLSVISDVLCFSAFYVSQKYLSQNLSHRLPTCCLVSFSSVWFGCQVSLGRILLLPVPQSVPRFPLHLMAPFHDCIAFFHLPVNC